MSEPSDEEGKRFVDVGDVIHSDAYQRLLPEIQARRERRKTATRGYKAEVAEISRLLFAADPEGINFETNTDEYDPEAETIILRLKAATSEADVLEIVFSEFDRWFGPSAAPRASLEAVSAQIWQFWKEQTPSEPEGLG
jgi:hypothetical protein